MAEGGTAQDAPTSRVPACFRVVRPEQTGTFAL